MASENESPRTGGGAATSAGIEFQQKVGGLIGAGMLAGRPVDGRLELGGATAQWIRFETEAPVDDILVATSMGGFIALQVKTTASLSSDPKSPFGKSVGQFVRHWLASRDGDGKLQWNRPLDPRMDRLVLVLGANSPENIRVHLPEALRLRSQPGGGQLTKAQAIAFEAFSECVAQAWTTATTARFDPGFPTTIAAFVRIITIDPAGPDRASALSQLESVVADSNDATAALNALQQVTARLMSSRGGIDGPGLRALLANDRVRLDTPPNYRGDINTLRAHSEKVATALRPYETIEATAGEPVSIDRDCQPDLLAAAESGSFLIVGEPGAGKSGVLNALARDLRDRGQDVVELAVDRYSVDTLEGLKHDLGLKRPLIEVLQAWDGAQPGWLIIDALDATRGGRGEGVFRTLIEQILEQPSRWRVIASIRTFDLRMGQQFRALFQGPPPVGGLVEKEFSNVRHIRVPSWSAAEFTRLLAAAPRLAEAIRKAPPALRELAAVPFNTRLLSELIKTGVVRDDLSHIASQAQLLTLYWNHRVDQHGLPGRACLRRVVEAMVASHALRASVEAAAGPDPQMIDTLERDGVLIKVDNDRWVQFRHHLLFDYVAARVLLDPSDLISGRMRFPKAEARGLMLAPALGFLMREIWDGDVKRSNFWKAAGHLLADSDGDPVIRSAAGRLCAEYPEAAPDTESLAQRVVANDAVAVTAFVHAGGSLAVRLEDRPDAPKAPWANLLGEVAANVAPVAGTVRFLLFRLIPIVDDLELRAQLGAAARALLAYGLTAGGPSRFVPHAIELTAQTFDTDPAEARSLISRIFTTERLAEYGPQEAPAVAHQIEHIAPVDPDFAREIYGAIYGFSVTEDRETAMGDSQIMSFRSNARQDYEMARYALSEFFPTFLEQHPDHATDAVIRATEGYVARDHPISPDQSTVEFIVGGRSARLLDDRSHIWAHNPGKVYGHDGDALLKIFADHLKDVEEGTALRIARQVVDRVSLGIFWSRLFIAAVARKDRMIELVLPYALSEALLLAPVTRKDAVDVVAAGYSSLSFQARERFEIVAQAFDFSDFADPDLTRESFLQRLFGAIGHDRLSTEGARQFVSADADPAEARNERLFRVYSTTESPEPYFWIEDLDRDASENQALMTAINSAKITLKIDRPAETEAPTTAFPATPSLALDALDALRTAINSGEPNTRLVSAAEGVMGQGLAKMVERQLTPAQDDPVGTSRLVNLLDIVLKSSEPALFPETEASFERGASWGSPAPRVEAAEAILDLVLQRPDLYPALRPDIEGILSDPHPAVRLQAGVRLVRLWDLDQEGFWRLLAERLAAEENLSVLEFLVNGVLSRVLHTDPEKTEDLVQTLLARDFGSADRQALSRKQVASLLTILWVSHQREGAKRVLYDWIADAANFEPELSSTVASLREVFVFGLRGEARAEDAGLRARGLGLAAAIVEVACEHLARHFERSGPTQGQVEVATTYAKLLDHVCRELYFASGAFRSSGDTESEIEPAGLTIFFNEAGPILRRIGDHGTPRTVYYLLQLLEYLVPVDPEMAFDLTANALKRGGRQTGYQFESLGADLLVRMVGVFLADHKELFEDADRRAALVQCLEIFMEAGWPSAHRLLYRLPELIQ